MKRVAFGFVGVIFILALGLVLPGGTWALKLEFGPRLRMNNFYGVAIDKQTLNAWVVGNYGVIARSDDGYKTWIQQPSGVKDEIFDVSFINDKVGWVVGRAGVVLHTTDGGNVWLKQESNTKKNLFSVCFTDALTGWIVGEQAVILHTSDGGKTWRRQSEEEDVIYNRVFFLDNLNGWVAGEFKTILHTADGGDTWTKQECPLENTTLYGLYFADRNRGWAVGMDGKMISTVDGGLNWCIVNSHSEDTLYDIVVIGGKGFAVGFKGAYVVSEDNGKTWKQGPFLNTYSWLVKITFGNEKTGCLVGSNGTILYTSDGGDSWGKPDIFVVDK